MPSPSQRAESAARAAPVGVGVGLRIEFAEALLADPNPPVDFLEIHPENYVQRGGAHATMLGRAVERFRIVTHGLTMGFGGTEAPSAERLRELRGLLDRVGSSIHSDHFCFASVDGRFPHELLPLPFDTRTVAVATERMLRMRDSVGRTVAVENVSYYVPRSRDPLDEVDVLVELLERADARLLLDVNNVVVNAHNHGFDPREFLARIPYERVAQIHVAGHFVRPDGLRIDTHGAAVDAEVRTLLEEVLVRTGPIPVLLERDAEIPPYEALAEELRALRALYDRAMLRAPSGAEMAAERRAASELRSRPRDEAEDPRAAEPRELEDYQRAVSARLLERAPWTLGRGLVDARWGLYRTMARGRLLELFRAALPRTSAALGVERFEEGFASFVDATGPRTPLFWRTVDEFATHLDASLDEGSLERDLLRFERARWRVRHAPYPSPLPASTFDFEGVACLEPARESIDVHHAVYLAEAAATPERLAAPTRVVVFRRDDEASVLVLNPLARAIFERFEQGTLTVRDAVVGAATERNAAIHPRFLEALAETLAQWIELGVVHGVRAD